MGGTVPKELRSLLKQAQKAGCVVEQTAKNHLRVLGPEGDVLTTVAGTTVNRRAPANLRTALRRAGVSIH